MQPKQIALLVAYAWTLAACSTSQQVSASADRQRDTARRIVGTSLIGARGATAIDQEKIDDTAAGLCGARVWTPSECKRHGRQ